MHPLVSASDLDQALRSGTAIAADVRWYLDGRKGRDAYERGHIPTAIFVDLDRVLAAPPGRHGRHPLPSPTEFAASMGALGIGDDDVVVAYDDASGSVAARLWWMLTATGHRAAVLDGGLQAWRGPLEAGAPVARAPQQFTPRPWPPEAVATIDDVAALRTSVLLVDARAPERYAGEVEPVDPRAGHIPGAVNLPWSGNIGDDGRFLPREVLRERFEAAGASEADDIVCYCGSGVTACHDLLALRVAGFDRARLYPGSWSEWAADPARPAATGRSAT